MSNCKNDTLDFLECLYIPKWGTKSWTWQLPSWRVGYLIQRRWWRKEFSFLYWVFQDFTHSEGVRMARKRLWNCYCHIPWLWLQITGHTNLYMCLPAPGLCKFQYATLTVIKEGNLSLFPGISNPRPGWKVPQQSCHLSWGVPTVPLIMRFCLSTPPRTVGCLSGVLGIWPEGCDGL